MCLTTVDGEVSVKKGRGWKEFIKIKGHGGRLYAPYRGKPKPYPIGVWINEKDYREMPKVKEVIVTPDGWRYKTGFHICQLEKDAIDYTYSEIREVEFRKVVATGNEGVFCRIPVIVAQEMKILRRKRRTTK